MSNWIKRVVALPGDDVVVADGVVVVNGERIDEPYVRWRASYSFPAGDVPVRIPPDHYFVLGDNRPESSDSHETWFGFIPAENLVGRAWLAY